MVLDINENGVWKLESCNSILRRPEKTIFEPGISFPFSKTGRMAEMTPAWGLTPPILVAYSHTGFGLHACSRQCDKVISFLLLPALGPDRVFRNQLDNGLL